MGLDNPLHILILAVIVMLVFGAKRLPELGKSLGAGIREFKGSVSGAPAPAAQIDDRSQPTSAELQAVGRDLRRGSRLEFGLVQSPEWSQLEFD